MSVQLPPLDARAIARRETVARLQAKGPQVKVAPWNGERHMRRWTMADALITSDLGPIAFALFIAYLMVGR